jgi:hypothetical protein
VKFVAIQRSTRITMTIANRWKSDGYADAITRASMRLDAMAIFSRYAIMIRTVRCGGDVEMSLALQSRNVALAVPKGRA